MTARQAIALVLTAVLGGALYFGWVGFRLGPVGWGGVGAVIGGTWLWDLRYPLIPAYVVSALWLVEAAAAKVAGRRR